MPPRNNFLTTQKATIGKLASETPPILDPTSKATREVIGRVRKCLDRADHPNTNESEAQTAMKMAHRIMDQHNISQLQIIQAEDSEQRKLRGRLSTVDIKPATLNGKVIFQTWVRDLESAVTTFFDCKAYSTERCLRNSIEWTFYGIAEQTVSAAMTFEMVHNLIQDWASVRTGVANRTSYSIGVAYGLLQIAEKEARVTERAAKSNEEKSKATDKRQRERKKDSHGIGGVHVWNDDEASEAGEEQADFIDDEETRTVLEKTPIREYQKPGRRGADQVSEQESVQPVVTNTSSCLQCSGRRNGTLFSFLRAMFGQTDRLASRGTLSMPSDSLPRSSAVEEAKPMPAERQRRQSAGTGSTAQWSSVEALVRFRKIADEIADDVLKDLGIKLGTDRKRKRSIRDIGEYNQGRKDSRKTNVRSIRAKRIKMEEHGADGL